MISVNSIRMPTMEFLSKKLGGKEMGSSMAFEIIKRLPAIIALVK